MLIMLIYLLPKRFIVYLNYKALFQPFILNVFYLIFIYLKISVPKYQNYYYNWFLILLN